jgi:hypothetical protein
MAQAWLALILVAAESHGWADPPKPPPPPPDDEFLEFLGSVDSDSTASDLWQMDYLSRNAAKPKPAAPPPKAKPAPKPPDQNNG